MFFDRFRAELARYAEGVHQLGDPTPQAELGPAWPAALQDLYRSWNGMRLFHDSLVLYPSALVSPTDGAWQIGEAPSVRLVTDERGRVREADEHGDSILVGST